MGKTILGGNSDSDSEELLDTDSNTGKYKTARKIKIFNFYLLLKACNPFI